MPKHPAHRLRRKPGFFHPVIVRARRDGWSVARQCAFQAELYFTRSRRRRGRWGWRARLQGKA